MKAAVLVVALTLAAASAYPPTFPGSHDGREWPHSAPPNQGPYPWAPAGPGDVRSPCPAMNSLANHFILPHNGKNITVAQAGAACETGFNFSSVICEGFAESAVEVSSALTNSTSTTFDLDILSTPHSLEHDGSLSRGDYDDGKGNNHDFNPNIWKQVMDFWGDNEYITYNLAESARVLRFATANRTDVPGWFEAATSQSLGESSFYLSVFAPNETATVARKDWISYWFTYERLPFELGWNTDQRPAIEADGLYAIIAVLATAAVSS